MLHGKRSRVCLMHSINASLSISMWDIWTIEQEVIILDKRVYIRIELGWPRSWWKKIWWNLPFEKKNILQQFFFVVVLKTVITLFNLKILIEKISQFLGTAWKFSQIWHESFYAKLSAFQKPVTLTGSNFNRVKVDTLYLSWEISCKGSSSRSRLINNIAFIVRICFAS